MSKWNKPSSQTYENAEATKKYSFRNAEPKIAVKLSPKLQKVVLKERSVSLSKLQKVVPKGAKCKRKVNENTAEIEGEEVQKTFLRECRTYTEK
jgi:hypothetical protein